MTTTNIKKGYQLHVKSWENDADHRKTHIINGLSKEDVSFLIDLFSYFKRDKFGNSSTAKGDVLKAYLTVKEKHPKVSREFKESWFLDEEEDEIEDNESYGKEDYTEDFVVDMLYENGIGKSYEGRYWRVFDGYEVFFFPEEIHNVTSKFRKF